MTYAAHSGDRVGQLVGLAAHVVDEFGDCVDWHAGMHDEDVWISPDDADRRKIFYRIIWCFRYRRHDRDDRHGRQEQRVAVSRRARDSFGRDGATGTGPIVHEELLPKRLAEALRNNARDTVGIS